MRKTLFILLLSLFFCSVHAAKISKEVTKSRASVATVLAYKGGELLGSCTAVFVGDKCDVLTSNRLFANADSAVVIDNAGKVHAVERIAGADGIYGCIRLRIANSKKLKPMALSTAKVAPGDELYLVSYGVKKNGFVEPVKVAKVDSLYSCAYYTLELSMQERYNTLPLVNSAGELVAIMQSAPLGDTLHSYAIGAAVFDKLKVTSANYGKGYIQGTAIRAALPDVEAEALSCLYMQAIVGDSVSYKNTIDEFLGKFPDCYEGYVAHAEYIAVYYRDMETAEKEWRKALAKTDKGAEVYFAKAKVLNSIVLSGDTVSHSMLSFENAIAALDKAISLDNQPLYLSYKADMLYAHGDYAAAATCYEALTQTNMRSALMFSKASQCYEQLADYNNSVAMLDSVVSMLGKFPQQAMPYVLTRALVKSKVGMYRESVKDFNAYESFVGSGLKAEFYYLREQAEVNGKMYQQALNDIETAIYLSPENPVYYIEKAMLCYRVKMSDEGIRTLEKAKELAPGSSDVYYLLGRLNVQKENFSSAKECFEKALSLGHPDAGKQLESLK